MVEENRDTMSACTASLIVSEIVFLGIAQVQVGKAHVFR
jgi:hypothetical protein